MKMTPPSPNPVHEDLFKSPLLRGILYGTMAIAFAFGSIDRFIPGNFERLHIFLFNLTSGGFILIYFTENRSRPSWKALLYFVLSILFALSAFFHQYRSAVVLTLLLGLLTDSIRRERFPWFPADFFSRHVPVSEKFHHAALLCLSLSLVIASVVIMNDTWFHWFHFEKLTLNVFFLGFSFPVSLLTMSIIFRFLNHEKRKDSRVLEDFFFWAINLGVIIFFIFIIFELAFMEAVIAFILFITVFSILTYFIRNGLTLQQNLILKSGIAFLVATAVTGFLYIIASFSKTHYTAIKSDVLLIHAYLSLYGWNLSGLLVVIRWNDFPLKFNTRLFILFHWLTIAILPPLAKRDPAVAVLGVAAYMGLLLYPFMGKRLR